MTTQKLLFLGADTSTEDAVKYAKSLGVYTIVTDYQPTERVPSKQIADEAWMIDVADTDALEYRCKKDAITAVFAGNHEFCIDQCGKLCNRLNLPFYASNDGWKATRDKVFYKEICTECGLATPPWIRLTEEMDLDNLKKLRFPIIVKPTDSNAGQGVAVVRSLDGVKPALMNALKYSVSKEVIAEEFIDGDELYVSCYIYNGKVYFLGLNENIPTHFNGRANFGLIAHSGRFNEYIKQEAVPYFNRVVERLGCKEGACVFQCIHRNGFFYHYEMGFRLDGVRTWRHHHRVYGTDELKLMVELALGITHEEKIKAFYNPREEYVLSAGCFIWAKPGQIKRITGLDRLYKRSDTVFLLDKFKEGDIVLKQNNMRSIAYYFIVYGDSQKELDEKINEVTSELKMVDQQGNNMLIYRNDYYKAWSCRMKNKVIAKAGFQRGE